MNTDIKTKKFKVEELIEELQKFDKSKTICFCWVEDYTGRCDNTYRIGLQETDTEIILGSEEWFELEDDEDDEDDEED